MQINLLLLLTTLLSASSCSGTKDNPGEDDGIREGPPPASAVPTKIITYNESFEDFPNPERGFYRYSSTRTSSYTPLTESQVRGFRSTHTPSGSSFAINSTLVFRYFVIDNANDQPLSEQTLQNFHQDMNTLRAAGAKAIPRFVYTTTSNAGACPEGFICPPYGDAPKNIVLQHIQQLKPFFEQHQDVIAVVQMGFIGTWGEQYYTDYFGDPSSNGGQGKLLDQNWKDREDVLRALLDAVPSSRMVQVRYPQMKQRFVLGVSAPFTSPGMNLTDAFNGSDIARIGIHNDCFLAGRNDIGTYEDYGNTATARSSNNAVVLKLREYAMNEGTYTAVGGETCRKDPNYPDCNCAPAGRAVNEMEIMHYSYLNVSYNQDVNNDWQAQGCADEIKRRLGYRFVLKKAELPLTAKSGSAVPFKLEVENVGFASPFNTRPVKLVFRNIQNNSETSIVLQTDVRKWFSGTTAVNEDIVVPQGLDAGTYELLLSLHDASESIADRVDYAVRVANEGTWEEATGLNRLNHQISIYK